MNKEKPPSRIAIETRSRNSPAYPSSLCIGVFEYLTSFGNASFMLIERILPRVKVCIWKLMSPNWTWVTINGESRLYAKVYVEVYANKVISSRSDGVFIECKVFMNNSKCFLYNFEKIGLCCEIKIMFVFHENFTIIMFVSNGNINFVYTCFHLKIIIIILHIKMSILMSRKVKWQKKCYA